jgi:purine nucleosidase
MRLLRKLTGALAILLLAVALLVALSLAAPVTSWRTGETSMPALDLVPGGSVPALSNRVWIDTDAACGTGARRDPDDCLALLALLEDSQLNVVGVSTVFGNAPGPTTQAVTRELVAQLNTQRPVPVRVFEGSSEAWREGTAVTGSAALPALPVLPAHRAIASALADGPMTFIALGPLTNLVAAVGTSPALQRNLAGIVAVMGRRPGHRFHPSEGRSPRAMLFGHGPVFSDLNLTSDPLAAQQVTGWGRPLILLPYEAARHVEMDAQALDALGARSAAGRWVAERSWQWLQFWQEDVGRKGFFPFDLMAAAFVLDPGQFRCANVKVWVGADPLFGIWQRGSALLVAPGLAAEPAPSNAARAWYCADVAGALTRPWPVRRAEDR